MTQIQQDPVFIKQIGRFKQGIHFREFQREAARDLNLYIFIRQNDFYIYVCRNESIGCLISDDKREEADLGSFHIKSHIYPRVSMILQTKDPQIPKLSNFNLLFFFFSFGSLGPWVSFSLAV